MSDVSFFIAFVAGLVSFVSPCVVPLVPAFLGYLAGTSIEKTPRAVLFWHSLLFVLGFSSVFAIVGVLLNGILSMVAYTAQIWLSRVAGIIIILFGLYLLGIITPAFLKQEHKFRVKRLQSKELTSFVFGAAFAVGWSPCVGAVLGAIFALAASMPGQAFWLLLWYSIGLGLPFLLVGLFANTFMNILRKSQRFLKYFNIIVGVLIVVLGILVFTNHLAAIAGNFTFLNRFVL